MRATLLAFTVLALAGGSFSACQSVTETIRISEQDAGKTITLRTGDTLLIELAGNITTGFNWFAAPQAPVVLDQIGDGEATPESTLPGAPGVVVLQFEAVAQRTSLLHLDYRRSWEADPTPAKTFEVTVVVKWGVGPLERSPSRPSDAARQHSSLRRSPDS